MYKEYPKFYNYEVYEYDRKSRSDDPLLSVEEVLEKHGKILEEYAIKNLMGPIPEENKYREVGSGESLDSRPEILKLLKLIESPAVKAILVVDVQRLSRGDLEDAGRLIKLLRYTNTYVITPYKTYDLNDEYDRDAFERELKRGNEYLEYFKKIQARGRLASVKEGNYIGSVPPYGFEKIEIKDDKKVYHTLRERKDEADAVRLIFEWYCNEDIGATAICRRLERLGFKSKNGNPKWTPSFIFTVIENVHYIGYVRWNWRKTVRIIEDQEVKILRSKAKNTDEYLLFKGKHDPIVSEELFYKAQEIKGKRHRTKQNLTLKNPLTGLVFCKCGYKMSMNSYRNKGFEYAPPKLVCNDQYHCKSGSVNFDEIYEAVCRTLEDCIADFDVQIKNNERDNTAQLHRDHIERLEAKLKALDAKEIEQWDAQYDPDPAKRLPPNIFKRLNEKLIAEREELIAALAEAKENMPTPINYRKVRRKFQDAVDALRDPELDARTKNEYLKVVVKRIEYEREPAVRITKANAADYGLKARKGLQWYTPPYKLHVELNYV